jgi:phage terminase large subunit-like protein
MGTGRPGQPKLADAVWIALLERYVGGETAAALAREHGVSESAVRWQARNRGWRKMDRPGAVYRWVQPPPVTPAPAVPEARGFGFDPDDLDGSEARALEQARLAAAEGRLPDFLALTQSVRATRRLKGRDARGAVADGADADADGADPLPPVVLRAAQRPPDGDWATWLFLGGRGAGKTLAGASWLAGRAEALGAGGRLALIGPTLHDVREVMIGGPSGLMSLGRWRAGRAWPRYEPSRRRLVFPGGAEAFVFSAEDPDSLRGPQFAAAWADEFCAWPRGEETLALLRMGLRIGSEPRLVVTTTPRPTRALRALRAEASCVGTHAATAENAAHLSAGFLEGLTALYGGTRRAAQEMEGLVVEAEGALFTSEMLAKAREHPAGGYRPAGYMSPRTPGDAILATDGAASGSSRPKGGSPYERVVVAVDPTTTHTGNACGIVVVARARGSDGVTRAHVLADRSAAGLSPAGWARRAVAAAREFGATTVVAEVNQGGDMVRAVLKAAGCEDGSVGFRAVRASRGKRARAEPVAALYEQGRVRHRGRFPALEEELMAFGGEDEGRYDLDRADALVWGVSDLLLGPRGEGPRISVLDWGGRPSGISARVW